MPRRHTESFEIFVVFCAPLSNDLNSDSFSLATKSPYAAGSFTLANQALVGTRNACTHVQFHSPGPCPTATSNRRSPSERLCRNSLVRMFLCIFAEPQLNGNQQHKSGLLLLSSQWPSEGNSKRQQQISTIKDASSQFDCARGGVRIHGITIRGCDLSVPPLATMLRRCRSRVDNIHLSLFGRKNQMHVLSAANLM
jgi:hypothetical protein